MTARSRLLLGALFLLHALPFLSRPALIGGDEPHYALMAHSLAVDGDVALEEDYLAVERGSNAAGRKFAGRRLDRHLLEREGRLHFSHPLGLPVLAAPLIAVQETLVPGAAPDVILGALGLGVGFAGLLAGSGLLRRLGLSAAESRLLAFALYFTTPLWFHSRLFVTEAYTWSIALLALRWMAGCKWRLASLALGSLFLLKEVNLLLILPVLAGVWYLSGRRRAALVAIGPLAAFVVWIVKNLLLYSAPFVTFQPFRLGDPVAGAIGLMIDPRHGLLPFAPILATALVAAGARRLRGWNRELETISLVAFLALFALTACWVAWGGGSSYGPRLLVPVIPALALSLAAAWRSMRHDAAGRLVFVLLLALGFTLQWSAATDPFHALWEPSVAELISTRPAMSLAGLAIGLGVARSLVRAASADGVAAA